MNSVQNDYTKERRKKGNADARLPDSKHLRSLLPGDTCTIMDHTLTNPESGEQIISVLVDRFLRSKKWPSN